MKIVVICDSTESSKKYPKIVHSKYTFILKKDFLNCNLKLKYLKNREKAAKVFSKSCQVCEQTKKNKMTQFVN